MTNQTIDTVDFAKALADETRQQIMHICCCKWLSVGEIVDATRVSQPTVSHHLSILIAGGSQNSFNWDRRTKKNRPPSARFSQAKKIYHACNVNTFSQCCCNDSLHGCS